MVVLLLSLHSNEMSLQVVQNVAKLNSWEQTVFSVTAVRWHGLIWEEMPSFSQEGSFLLLFKGYHVNGLLILTSLVFLWRIRICAMLGLSFLVNMFFSSHWNPLQRRWKRHGLCRQPGPAAPWKGVKEGTWHPQLFLTICQRRENRRSCTPSHSHTPSHSYSPNCFLVCQSPDLHCVQLLPSALGG